MSTNPESAPISAGGHQPRSVAEAYRSYAQRTAWWVRRLGGVEIDAEDIVQEIFIIVSRRFSSFRGESSFASWLFGITRKVVANHLRHHRVRTSSRNPDVIPAAMHASSPDVELERRQAALLFYRALDELAEKYRTVLVLFEVEGLPIREIAELCGARPSTVKVHLVRARAKFIRSYQALLKQQRRLEPGRCAPQRAALSLNYSAREEP